MFGGSCIADDVIRSWRISITAVASLAAATDRRHHIGDDVGGDGGNSVVGGRSLVGPGLVQSSLCSWLVSKK